MQGIKCVVVGDDKVGKSCMVNTYVSNEYPQDTSTTLPYHSHKIEVHGKEINLEIYDTTADEDFVRTRYLNYPGTDFFIICFSLISPTSFANVEEKWLPELRHHNPLTPIMLVGMKLDLIYDTETLRKLRLRKMRPITLEDGEEMAKKIGAVKYLECSALNNEGLQEVFNTATRIGSEPPSEPEKKASKGFFSSIVNFFRK